MDELFSVFSAPAASTSTSQGATVNGANGTSPSSPKRDGKKRSPPATDINGSATEEAPAAKRAKADHSAKAAPEPIRADEFEEEAQREVVASKGLAGPAEDGQNVILSHQVRHQVALPASQQYEYVPIAQHVSPEPPAREYAFKLDPFQKVAIHSIERNESVLVSAHTSAGKTAVAEYAIAQCLRDKQRVIYTSPIKALSNQKYRDMLEEFGDVGLMTGDVTINPSASCLVMTTEILRSMLYRGSEIMREVSWVIFDEIHYMRDKERGVVWEETIILLPHKVHYVFLSATIPNAMEFAEWICKTHLQPCHVVYTDFRPTPLQHYLFPAGGDGIHLVVDEKSVFREDNFNKAMGTLGASQGEDPADPSAGKGRRGKSRKGGTKGPSDIYKIVKMIMTKNYNPVIVFAFSKRETESLALQMSKLEFNTDDEKDTVAKVFHNAISGLSDDDRLLPQIEHILPLLKRGIGIHHGGLLPILKEVIEILFQEGLIKCLFATETFSIGLNMPAKTVVFTNVRKFDGKDFRNLSSGEYIQMSGRAGRRGLDDRGIVVMMVDEKLEPAAARNMVQGEADRLDSAFHLGYNMILNLMRVEGVSPEFMLERCFYQFQSTTAAPKLEIELKEMILQRDALTIDQEEDVAEYWTLRQQLDIHAKDLRDVLNHPTYALPFLQPGRLVRVNVQEGLDFGWGVVVNFNKRVGPRGKPLSTEPPQKQYIVDVLMHVTSAPGRGRVALPNGIRPPQPDEKGEYSVLPVLLSTLDGISHIRIFLPKDLKPADARATAFKSVAEVQRRFPDGVALLDPVQNMGITDDSFKKLVNKIETLETRLLESPLHGAVRLPQLYDQYAAKDRMGQTIRDLKKRINDAQSVIHLDELKRRKRTLRRLDFCTSEDVVSLKGRVACEISTGDELLLTEMIFNRVFDPLSPEQCAAVLSCFVFQEKSESTVKLKDDLAEPLRSMKEAAQHIAKVSAECKLEINENEYVASFKPELMDVVYQWCRGAKFSDVCKMTDVFEGSLIRTFRRLQELIRQMSMAARAIGNEELEEKFNASLICLERQSSVVFNPSLYL